MFYATQLFAVLGQSGDAALLSTAIVGAVNVGSTIIAIVLVDRSVCMSILLLLLMHGSTAVLPRLYVLHVHCQAAIQLVDVLLFALMAVLYTSSVVVLFEHRPALLNNMQLIYCMCTVKQRFNLLLFALICVFYTSNGVALLEHRPALLNNMQLILCVRTRLVGT